uniref:Uncharacterized protein n=1 Tax=Candidatus Kentrum sp. TC TaxID=2126339 RepID=A0A450Z4R9_9GAMM|nr:MAG: hypothetical protein BECKTC1821E_GA0114239_100653 [Candidatus Kentron sp. TC]VFK48794.1 MAG: hypothetical protein BECKTC1821D_GA0114238_106320 [Candidatus Kentron sp. TC]VFK55961.1 MAG: hypothetical protein BECKTC1821F_GA0114240_100854 [Candidatus Kentron sp. TC]
MDMPESKSLSALLAGAFVMTMNATVFAAGCEYSKWGKNDERGAANYITPELVLASSR